MRSTQRNGHESGPQGDRKVLTARFARLTSPACCCVTTFWGTRKDKPSAVFRPWACSVSLTLGLRLKRLLEVFGVNTRFGSLRPGQYSSGSKIQVDERSASVMIQILIPVLSE